MRLAVSSMLCIEPWRTQPAVGTRWAAMGTTRPCGDFVASIPEREVLPMLMTAYMLSLRSFISSVAC